MLTELWIKIASSGGDRTRVQLLEDSQQKSFRLSADRHCLSARTALPEASRKSETLRDLGNDRVAFRHDVLREWAIANLLFSDPTLVQRLPLDRLALAGLARGVELAARIPFGQSTSKCLMRC